MLHIIRYLLFIYTIFIFTNVMALESDWDAQSESRVRLIFSSDKNNNQSEIFLGLEYQLEEGWKTYWQSPGDGGFPQDISWKNSKNIESLEILWPTPIQFEILGFQSIGYKDKVIFPLKLKLEDINKITNIILDVNYLVCKDICIPGNAFLKLNISPGLGNLTDHSFALEKTISELPQQNLKLSFLEKADINYYNNKNLVSIELEGTTKYFFDNPKVFLHTKYGLPVSTPNIKLSSDLKVFKAKFIFEKNLIKDKKFLTQFIINDQNQSFLIKNESEVKYQKNLFNNNYIMIILIAFFGGLILNAMPCVLPILSIKLLSVIKNIEDKSSIRRSFITTSAGIITSFVCLAASLIFVRHIGYNISWGIQFQQPIFLIFISLILILFSFNMFGFYEISIPTFINKKLFSNSNHNFYIQNFFNGFFATLMATPCSAPFVGTALTFAFTQSSIMMLLIFISMGLGMSLPYFLLAFFPQLLKFFPKPGKWMIYLKYFLGILLLATLIWVGNILLSHFNYYFIFFSLIIIIIALFSNYFFIYKKTINFILIICLFILPNFSFFQSNYIKEDINWFDFNKIDIKELVANGSIVFVDVTADWCATCQFNKINVLKNKQITENFLKFKVVKVKADWTKPNKKIENFLQDNNKFGIPLNIIYDKKNPDGIILSELLSVNEIIDILNKL